MVCVVCPAKISFLLYSRETKVFMNKDNCIIVVAVSRLTGQDGTGDWVNVEQGVCAVLLQLEQNFNFHGHHERQGDYLLATYSVSFGSGQKVCMPP